MTPAEVRKGSFGRPIRDRIAVVDRGYKISAVFAAHNVAGAVSYIDAKKESARKFEWPEPNLCVIDVPAGFERGDLALAPCRRCGGQVHRLTVRKKDGGHEVRCACGTGSWSLGERHEVVVQWNELQREREHVR